jgi:phosphoglycerate dehydrogenase-like enzyme
VWSAPNILISPHTAGGGSAGGGGRIASVVAENLARFREGRELIHQVEI